MMSAVAKNDSGSHTGDDGQRLGIIARNSHQIGESETILVHESVYVLG